MNSQQNSSQPLNITFFLKNQGQPLHTRLQQVSQEWKVSQIFNCYNQQDAYKYLGSFFNYIIQEQQLQQQFNFQNNQINCCSLINQLIDTFQIPQEFLDPHRNLQYLQKIANRLKISLTYHYNLVEQKFQPHQINFQPIEIKLETIIAITLQNNMIQIQFGIHNVQTQFVSNFPAKIQQNQWGGQKDFNKAQFPPQQFQPKADLPQPIFQQNKIQFNPPFQKQNNFQDQSKNFPLGQVPLSNNPWQKQNTFPQPFQKGNSQQSEEDSVLATQVANSRIDDQQIINEDKNESVISGRQRLSTSKVSHCAVCLEMLSDQQVICLPCCNKLIHSKCLQDDLKEKAQNHKLFNKLTCCFCEKPFKNEFFMNKIDKKLINEIIITEITSKCKFCFKCKQKFLLQQEQGNDKQISCNNCQQKICNQCFKEYHGNTECRSVRDEIIELLKGQPIVVCPFCNLLFTKNENCDHVKCEGCKYDLCSFCSVDRRPILTHGNHFHRYGCAHFSAPGNFDRNTKEERIRNCQYCKSNGPCKFPIDLETYRREKKY